MLPLVTCHNSYQYEYHGATPPLDLTPSPLPPCNGNSPSLPMKWIDVAYQILPPTDEVWGKVMFLHLSVILFIGVCGDSGGGGGRGVRGRGACMVGGRGCAW